MKTTTLTREAILASKPETFTVNWNGLKCQARKLSEVQFSEFNAWQLTREGKPNPANLSKRRQRLISLCLINEDGSLMFPGSDWHMLDEVDAETISELWEQIAEGCGLKAKTEETPLGNSRNGSSTTTD